MNIPRSIPVDNILPPDPPGNDIDPEVVAQLRLAYQRGDPLPAITVYPSAYDKPGEWLRLLFGQHRLRAQLDLGWRQVMAVVLPSEPAPLEKITLQFRENNNRKKLSAIEQAELFLRAMQAGGLNGKQVAKVFDVSEGTVSRCLAIHRNLVDPLKALVARLQMVPKAAYKVSMLPQAMQEPFWAEHHDKTAEEIDALVEDRLVSIKNGKPKDRPVTVSVGSTRATLPNSPDAALADLKKLTTAIKALSDKGASMADLDVFLRITP